MVSAGLLQTALDVLMEINAKRAPLPERVNELRRARPELDHLHVAELACEILLGELAKQQEEKIARRLRTA